MKIRLAKLGDVNQMYPIWKELMDQHFGYKDPYFKGYAKDVEKRNNSFYRKCIKDKKKNLVLVAEENGNIMGYLLGLIKDVPPVFKKAKFLFVLDFVVSKKYRGHGVGTLLMKETEKILKKRKISMIMLEVHVKNKNAQGFYNKLGFKGHTFHILKEIR
jgi:ribosomal protein S18 acetylase RimI-like enzyme